MKRATDPSFLDEAVRAVSGYYGRLGRIGLDLAAIVIPIDQLRDAAARLPAASPAPTVPTSPTLVVEADGDRPGLGAFLVENLTADPVSAPIHVSAFVDERGREVRPRLGLRPSTVSLGPGEQAVVRLVAKLDDALEPGVAYRGEITIPGVTERRIPVVLRRRLAGEPPAGDEPPAPRPPTRRSKGADRAAAPTAAAPTAAAPRKARTTTTKRTTTSPRVTPSADDIT